MKTPGSGRQKGTPNKKTQDLQAICDAKGINPFEALLELCGPEYDEGTRLQALKEVCSYLYAKRKALEVSNADDKGFRIILEDYTIKESK